jgi:predicted membrane protein
VLFVVSLLPHFNYGGFMFLVFVVLPPAGFMLFRLQECFTTSLFQAWSREEGASGLALVRESVRFVASILGYMFIIPFSLMVTLFTFIFAVILIPLFIYYWIRYFNRQLREKQRDLVRNFCRQCGDSIHHPDMERLYPGPLTAKKRPNYQPPPRLPGQRNP